MKVTYYPLETETDAVKLTIIGNSTSYTLGYAEGSRSFTYPLTIDSARISLPTVGGFAFVGSQWGVYNTGNGKPSLVPADFAYWRQTPSNATVNSTTSA